MKPEVHQELTRQTIETFSDRLPKEIIQNKDAIIKGTKAEDNWWEPSRAWNWHFYRQNSRILKKTRFLRMNPTSENIFSKRIEQMQSYSKDDPKRYAYLGRIIHHIQDMSTPSHVCPVYHGPVKQDHFETFMAEALKKLELDSRITETTVNPNDDLETLYENAAQETLGFLDSQTFSATVNEEDKALKLTMFWRSSTDKEDEKYRGFGTYGILHTYFQTLKPMTIEENRYTIKLDELYRLNDAVCHKAIRDTFRALISAVHPRYNSKA